MIRTYYLTPDEIEERLIIDYDDGGRVYYGQSDKLPGKAELVTPDQFPVQEPEIPARFHNAALLPSPLPAPTNFSKRFVAMTNQVIANLSPKTFPILNKHGIQANNIYTNSNQTAAYVNASGTILDHLSRPLSSQFTNSPPTPVIPKTLKWSDLIKNHSHFRFIVGAACLNCEGSGFSLLSSCGPRAAAVRHPIKTLRPYTCPFCQGKRVAPIPLADIVDPDFQIENPDYYWSDSSVSLEDTGRWRYA